VLVLTRKPGQSIKVGEVVIKVLNVSGNRVKIGIDAPSEVRISRTEAPKR